MNKKETKKKDSTVNNFSSEKLNVFRVVIVKNNFKKRGIDTVKRSKNLFKVKI